MQSVRIDIQGKSFGRLRVVTYSRTDGKGRALWLCRCSCGVRRVVAGAELRTGRTKACRKCTRAEMGERARALNERRAPTLLPQRAQSPEEVMASLTPELRARYERWEANVKRLGVYVSPEEKMQFLREAA